MASFNDIQKKIEQEMRDQKRKLESILQKSEESSKDEDLVNINLTITDLNKKLDEIIYKYTDEPSNKKPIKDNATIEDENIDLNQLKTLKTDNIKKQNAIDIFLTKVYYKFNKEISKLNLNIDVSNKTNKNFLETINKKSTKKDDTPYISTLNSNLIKFNEKMLTKNIGFCKILKNSKMIGSVVIDKLLNIFTSKPTSFYVNTMKAFDTLGGNPGKFLDNIFGPLFNLFGFPGNMVYDVLFNIVGTGGKLFRWVIDIGVSTIDKLWKTVKLLEEIGWKAISNVFNVFYDSAKSMTGFFFDMLINVFSNPLVLTISLGTFFVYSDKIWEKSSDFLGTLFSKTWEVMSIIINSSWDNISRILGFKNGEELNNNIITLFNSLLDVVTQNSKSFWDNTFGKIIGISTNELISLSKTLFFEIKDIFPPLRDFISELISGNYFIKAIRLVNVSKIIFNELKSGSIFREIKESLSLVLLRNNFSYYLQGDPYKKLLDQRSESTLSLIFEELNAKDTILSEMLPYFNELAINVVSRNIIERYSTLFYDIMSDIDNKEKYRKQLVSTGKETLNKFLSTYKFGNDLLPSFVTSQINIDINNIVSNIMDTHVLDLEQMKNKVDRQRKEILYYLDSSGDLFSTQNNVIREKINVDIGLTGVSLDFEQLREGKKLSTKFDTLQQNMERTFRNDLRRYMIRIDEREDIFYDSIINNIPSVPSQDNNFDESMKIKPINYVESPNEMAKGGVVNKPILTWIGEGEDSELVIPINNNGLKFVMESMKDLYNPDNDNEINNNMNIAKENAKRIKNNVIRPKDKTLYDLKAISEGMFGVGVG